MPPDMAVDTFNFSSSMIESGEYDDETQEMTLTMLSGGDYPFYGVPPEVWAEFKHSVSPGGFYHANIKGRFGG